MHLRYLLVIILFLPFSKSLSDQKIIKANKIDNNVIKIDGLLDEYEWLSHIFLSDLIQRNPIENSEPTEKTEFSVLYDLNYLYIGVKLYTKDVSSIRKLLSPRDQDPPSDWIYVSIDSYDDNRTAFEFGLNPISVKRDLLRYDDESTDINWDSNWEGKAALLNDGWSVEFKIPFSVLRFSRTSNQSWGLQVHRYISKNNEDDYWTYWPKKDSGWVRHYGILTNLINIRNKVPIEIIPYITDQIDVSKSLVNPVNPHTYKMNNRFGADAKIGITNNLTLNISLNPDFGHVEADASEINLSAFETYFTEKRYFFKEGDNIFNFRTALNDDNNSNNTLFYSRRIGATPKKTIVNSDTSWVINPSVSRIISAEKISGKTSNGWSIGILNATTNEEKAKVQFLNSPTKFITIDPLTNHFIARIQKDFKGGTTTFGGIFTSLNRRINSEDLNDILRSAYTSGLDFSHIFLNDKYMVSGSTSITKINGSKNAINKIQTNSTHYFQRIGAEHLSVDSLASQMTGYSHSIWLQKIKGKYWRWGIGEYTYSPEYEANELGYHQNSDIKKQLFWLQRRNTDPRGMLINSFIDYNIWNTHTFGKEQIEFGSSISIYLIFKNYMTLNAGSYFELPVKDIFALRGGPAVKNSSEVYSWLSINTDSRKVLSLGIMTYGGKNMSGSWDLQIYPSLIWRPTTNIELTISNTIIRHHNTWSSWLGYDYSTNEQTGDNNYLVAELDQKTVSTTLRLNYTITPNFSLQFYGSPYFSAGTYNNFSKLVDPNGSQFEDRFSQFGNLNYNNETNYWQIDEDGDGIPNYRLINRDFNFKEFNSSAVLRWEFRTGSYLSFIWSNNSMDYVPMDGSLLLSRDIKKLVRSSGTNSFLIKFSYLFKL